MTHFSQQIQTLIASNELAYKPTQKELSIPLLQRLYNKFKAGLIGDDPILVAEDLIIDGHHRYIAACMNGLHLNEIPSHKNFSQEYLEWNQVQLSDKDYDTPAEIRHHIHNDAETFGLTDIEVEQIIKS